MPFKKQDIDELMKLHHELKKDGQLTPAVDYLVRSLFTIVSYQFEQIEGLKEENENLKKRIQELEAKSKKNSKNSSLPPSKDDNRKRGSNRKSTGRSPGGQLGHEGFTLQKVKNPDKKVLHKLDGRCHCGRALSKSKKKAHQERQVFDIEIKRTVTSHLAEVGECKCGRVNRASFPEGVNNHTQYGQTARTLASYFCQYQLTPFERTQEIFNDVFGLGLCKASVFNHTTKAAHSLNNFKEWAKAQLLKSKLNHADETGLQVIKDRHHLHVLSNNSVTLLEVHKSRGIEAVEAMGVLKDYKGKLVHDCYAMYFGYPCKDIICNAHLERELAYFDERESYKWAAQMKAFLEELYNDTQIMKEDGRKKRTTKEFIVWQKRYRKVLREARRELKELIRPKGKKQEKVVNLYFRMKKHERGILWFAKDFSIPYTNNQAERDVRMAKVHQKISGCFRSLEAAQNWALLRSYISTMKKRGINVLEGLSVLFGPSSKDPVYQVLGHPG